MAVETRTSSIDLKGDPGPFLARIVSHLDTTYMGGLEVEILKTTEDMNLLVLFAKLLINLFQQNTIKD